MTFRCLDKNKNRVVREVSWIYIKNAWVPVVTVCTHQLYPQNVILSNVNIPNVNNLNLSLQNLGLNISWGSNSNYDTEISYNRNNTDWEILIIEGNETMVDLNPGDTLQVRARFTDGNGNYSANYTTASITVWNMEDFTLYGLTENVNDSSSEANTIYEINTNSEFYPIKLKTFTPENIDEENHKIFSFNGLIYRLVYRYRDSYQGYEFESIDPVTLEVTPIQLSSNEFNCSVQAMCFDAQNQYAYISTACGFYRLELNGVVTQLSSDSNNIKAMTFYNDQLLALQDNDTNGPIKCYVIDTSNGAIGLETFTVTVSGYTTTSAYSLTTHNGNLYAVINGNNNVDYAGLILISIEINETVDSTFISQLTDPSRSLCSEEISPYDIMELIFEKLNPDTLEVTNIETSGLSYEPGTMFSTSSYINDGGEDMYDGGNLLSTNIQDNGFIEYTHTQQPQNDEEGFVEIADGAVEDGTNWFGSGSTYFTNMYNGLFVMVARDIDITEFTISGELGADGSGSVAQETITLNGGHKGYFKKVYDAGDPSVNHLIIIPSKNGVVSNIVGDTDEDFHNLTNLSGVDYIYYLLFATAEGENSEVTTEQAQTIGNSFLSTITGSGMTASNILTRLNSGVTNITENIPDMYLFSDYVGEDQETYPIGYKPGLFEPHCMTYQAGNKFLVSCDNGLFSITTDGLVSLVGTGFHWQECRGLAFVGDRLFASFSSVDQIAEIDPYTGDILSQVNKKGWSVVVDAGENQLYTYAIRALAGNDDGLFIMSYNDGDTHTIAFISNLVPDENNTLYATSIGTFRASGGLTIEKFGKTKPPGNWFLGYNEEFTGIHVPAYDNEELIELNANELEVQWHEDGNADQSYTGWSDIEVQEIIQPEGGEGGDFIVVIDKPVNSFKIRMRFNNPVSKWSYYEWD
jgi:hypothetical protein